MKKYILCIYGIFTLSLLFYSKQILATTYYVDPSSTSLLANGSLSSPWKSISQVNTGVTSLLPGDMVLFKRGQTYSGRLNIPSSGSLSAPIIYGNYGTGNLPEFNNAITDIIRIYNKQYIIIDGIKFIDNSISSTDHTIQANISYAIIVDNSPNCTIRNCDISLVGVGISVTPGSDNTTITGNYMHNMRMVKNTPTSINSNDDYGANPMVISSSNNSISNNRFEECWAISYDYGYDGGAVELFGSSINNNNIIYNTAINCDGFIEIGSSSGGVCNNNKIAYNKIINCGVAGTLQNSGTFSVSINNLQFYNNTMVETVLHYQKAAYIFWMSGTGTTGMLVSKNNIFWLSTGVNIAQTKFSSGQLIHENNIYRMTSGGLGFTLNISEMLSNTLNIFTNASSGDPNLWDLTLLPGNTAIDFGTNVGLTSDFSGNSIIGNPDAGIYEYKSPVSNTLLANSSSGIISCYGGNTNVTVSATGGTTPYSGTGTFNVTAGSYSYTVTDAIGNKSITSITISEPAALKETISSGTILTSGGSTSVIINTYGGISPYSYSINNGIFQSSNIFNNIFAGTYTLTSKDSNGCVISQNYTLTEPTLQVSSDKYAVNIYPNPTSNYFTLSISKIKGSQQVGIEVYNLNNILLLKTKLYNYQSINFGSNYIAGTYILKTNANGVVKTYKLLKL